MDLRPHRVVLTTLQNCQVKGPISLSDRLEGLVIAGIATKEQAMFFRLEDKGSPECFVAC